MKKTAVVVAPGRGTYNRQELGYLNAHHAKRSQLFCAFDSYRASLSQETISALDGAARFSSAKHTRGDNASPLIFACAFSDFLAIDHKAIDILAVTGNSMGWYIALACAGALDPMGGFELVNSMGRLMQRSLIGGQLVYPFVDDDWIPIKGQREDLLEKIDAINDRSGHRLTMSIDLGGMLVLAGNNAGLDAFSQEVPQRDQRFPMRLINHAAFHSHLQKPVAEAGRAAINIDLFRQPDIPLIDGRGFIWYPKSTSLPALFDYTLNHQIVKTYDFTAAIRTAAREFMPDIFIILGPGKTLGGATAQSLVLSQWRGLRSKSDFKALQATSECLVAMGDPGQRSIVVPLAGDK